MKIVLFDMENQINPWLIIEGLLVKEEILHLSVHNLLWISTTIWDMQK